MGSSTSSFGLEKQEAVDLLNEIVKTCFMPRFIALEQSGTESPITHSLRLKGPFDAKDWNCLKGIILEHDLSMKETDNGIVIYRQTN